MKIAEKPKTRSSTIECNLQSYAVLVRHEKACAAKLAERVKKAERLQRLSIRGYRNLNR